LLASSVMGRYLDANGVHTYYETAGGGDTVVLLHGGMSTADSWLAQIPALAEHYRVVVPERRGHGRTADVDGPITYRLMADDTAAFLDVLNEGPVHVVGWSDGAAVGALLALGRPDLVRRMVLIGQYFTLDGMTAQSRGLLEHGEFMERLFRPQYDPLSPDGPEHFPVVFAKMLEMWRREPDIPVAEFAGITAPTLIMQGDGDLVEVGHSAAVARTLPTGQLAVVPGTSHAAPIEKPELVNRMILDFLADRQSPTLF
jgi:pimeloyl-ACP methyl ester carboxylesterase